MGLPPTDPMPDWQHTHNIYFRNATFPVLAVDAGEVILFFRSDGGIEWILSKKGSVLMYRGTPRREARYESRPEFRGRLHPRLGRLEEVKPAELNVAGSPAPEAPHA